MKLIVLLTLLMLSSAAFGQEEAWPVWTKHPLPLYSGQFYVASDVTVLDEGDHYLMTYTCIDFLRPSPRALICAATSPDGMVWEPITSRGKLLGLALYGRDGNWDEDLEGAFLVKRGADDYWLYYSGYTDEGGYPAKGYPAALALSMARSDMHFERYQTDPILEPTPGWYDNDAIYSPVVFEYGGEWVMIYAGHCYTDCDEGYGVTLLAATSPDGIDWTKRTEPVLTAMPEEVEWTRDGVAEPAVVVDADGRVTLFFTGLRDADRWLGIARADSPFDPYTVSPEPILKPTPSSFDEGGVLAPHVLIEDGVARMWYLGVQPVEGGEYYHVGYAEAVWESE